MKSEILSSEIIFHEFLKVEKTSVRWEKFEGGMGTAGTRYVVRRGDSVGVVPVCSGNGQIILVNQFRFPAIRGDSDGYLWEIPAGMVDGLLSLLSPFTSHRVCSMKRYTSFLLPWKIAMVYRMLAAILMSRKTS